MKHVIIGAGAAGISAAKTIRRLKSTDEIVIISSDDAVHSRCMLLNYISGERDEKGLNFVSDDFFAKNNIRWVAGKTVTKVDTNKKLVNFADCSESFDTLLIATGSDSFELPLLQLRNAKNVFGLRHLSDAKAIKEQAKNANNIVIIGAGLVGLDAAYAFADTDKNIAIIDMSDSILSLNLDTYASGVYQQKFEEAGCTFYLGCKVSDTTCDANSNITSVMLDSGKKLSCDMVIVSIGSTPTVKFLADSGIVCNNGITVNDYLATNIANIYAAGDVTGLSGIWPNAVNQGEVAAKNMCGVPTVYDDVFALKNTINYFGIPSLSLGKTEPCEGETAEVHLDKAKFEKIIMRDGVVVGVILQGCIAHSGFWQFLIKNKINVSKVNKSVFDLTFADFYSIQENGEYKWVY